MLIGLKDFFLNVKGKRSGNGKMFCMYIHSEIHSPLKPHRDQHKLNGADILQFAMMNIRIN